MQNYFTAFLLLFCRAGLSSDFSDFWISGELGQGWFSTVYRVAFSGGLEVAMKVDKEPKSLEEADIEVSVLNAITKSTNCGPKLITSFEIETASNSTSSKPDRKGRRYTLMSLVGSDIKAYMKKNNLDSLSLITAASIGVQIVDAATILQSVGFVHNDIHSGNVAFATPTTTSQVVLLDFGLSRRIQSVALSASTVNQFSTETVYNDFVIPEFPNTDLDWFRWAIEGTGNDDSIVDLLAVHSWSLLAQVAIRNARIVARIARSRRTLHLSIEDSVKALASYAIAAVDPQTEADWFEWALLYAESEEPIVEYMTNRTVTGVSVGVIMGTRNLAQFIVNDSLKRRELGRILKTFLEMTGVALTDSQFDIVIQGEELSFFNVLELSDLRTIFLSVIESRNESYQGHILWN